MGRTKQTARKSCPQYHRNYMAIRGAPRNLLPARKSCALANFQGVKKPPQKNDWQK